MNEVALMESKSLRNEMVNKDHILDKVKRLNTLPDDIHVTTQMVADYYEVEPEVIRTGIVKRHRDELLEDGMKVVKGSELREWHDATQLSTRAAKHTLYPRRAVLRIGMLLRDSDVAKKVRSYLLDSETHMRTSSFSKEMYEMLASGIARALINDKLIMDEISNLREELYDMKQANAQNLITTSSDNNDATVPANNILEIKKIRNGIHSLIRAYGYRNNQHSGSLYNQIYAEIKKETGVDISSLAKKNKKLGIEIVVEMGLLNKMETIVNNVCRA